MKTRLMSIHLCWSEVSPCSPTKGWNYFKDAMFYVLLVKECVTVSVLLWFLVFICMFFSSYVVWVSSFVSLHISCRRHRLPCPDWTHLCLVNQPLLVYLSWFVSLCLCQFVVSEKKMQGCSKQSGSIKYFITQKSAKTGEGQHRSVQKCNEIQKGWGKIKQQKQKEHKGQGAPRTWTCNKHRDRGKQTDSNTPGREDLEGRDKALRVGKTMTKTESEVRQNQKRTQWEVTNMSA